MTMKINKVPIGATSDDEWIEYLKDTNNYANYDGTCDCNQCQAIHNAFYSWKARKNSLVIKRFYSILFLPVQKGNSMSNLIHVKDEELSIWVMDGIFHFAIVPPKELVNAAKAYKAGNVAKESLDWAMQQPEFELCRNLSKDQFDKLVAGQPIPIDRKRVSCIEGIFYLKEVT